MIAGTVIVVDNKFIASHFNLSCIHDADTSWAFLNRCLCRGNSWSFWPVL